MFRHFLEKYWKRLTCKAYISTVSNPYSSCKRIKIKRFHRRLYPSYINIFRVNVGTRHKLNIFFIVTIRMDVSRGGLRRLKPPPKFRDNYTFFLTP